jgi:Rieske Fe-S protein
MGSHPTTQDPSSTPARRTVLRGAAFGTVAAPFLVACAGDEAAAPEQKGTGSAGNTDVPTPSEAPSPEDGGQALASTSEVPVGGGTVLPDQKVVLTQPEEGQFKAFTAVCTHQGCVVASVAEGTINCGCHGSQFAIEDGANVGGPNGTAGGSVADLAEIPISVEGDRIIRG